MKEEGPVIHFFSWLLCLIWLTATLTHTHVHTYIHFQLWPLGGVELLSRMALGLNGLNSFAYIKFKLVFHKIWHTHTHPDIRLYSTHFFTLPFFVLFFLFFLSPRNSAGVLWFSITIFLSVRSHLCKYAHRQKILWFQEFLAHLSKYIFLIQYFWGALKLPQCCRIQKVFRTLKKYWKPYRNTGAIIFSITNPRTHRVYIWNKKKVHNNKLHCSGSFNVSPRFFKRSASAQWAVGLSERKKKKLKHSNPSCHRQKKIASAAAAREIKEV